MKIYCCFVQMKWLIFQVVCQMGYLERQKMVLYCAFLVGLEFTRKYVFCFVLRFFVLRFFCLSSNPNFFKIVLKFYKCIELQYFDLELTYNCLLSVNKICWFWWSEQLKKRKNCLKFSIKTDTWIFIIYDETKIFT